MEALPALVKSYNKAYHRSIGTAPERVTQTNAQEIWHRLYGKDFVKRSAQVRFKFKVGDKVRISKKKGTFEKLDGRGVFHCATSSKDSSGVPPERIRWNHAGRDLLRTRTPTTNTQDPWKRER